jgi:branched-chain amino acid transport system ATP-binding protein
MTLLRVREDARTRVEILPYGVQRMVELGVALALQPTLLLLDEPAAGVPRGEVGIIFEAIARLPASMAVLLIEHDIDVVFRFATRVVVLVAGAVLRDGTPQQIGADEEVRALYLGSHA